MPSQLYVCRLKVSAVVRFLIVLQEIRNTDASVNEPVAGADVLKLGFHDTRGQQTTLEDL